MAIALENQVDFYHKLHQRWKAISETSSMAEIFDLTLSFLQTELSYQRALILVHDDATGLFRVQAQTGYEDERALKLLKIVTLLLSGEIIDYLRTVQDHLVHTLDQPQPLVASLLRTLGMQEASMMLFAGNANVPFGLIIAGNRQAHDEMNLHSPCSAIAFRNLIANLAYATNNVLFYQSWHNERLFLQENIEKRTKELNEQKETFEGIYQTSKDGIAILDVHTTGFLAGNPAYLEMTGYTHTELLRTSCLAVTHQDDRSRSMITMQEVLRQGFVKDFVKRCIAKDGRILSVNMSMVLMSDQQRVLVTTKDISERIALEKALHEAKDRIEAAHNHTLSSIEYASLIQRSLLPEAGSWQRHVRDAFCIWQPKDVVGGDLYSVVPCRNGDDLLIIMVDCTGHGVPGAFVTMLVKAIEQQVLHKISTSDEPISPARILELFHAQLVQTLKYDEQMLMKHVGFDGAIVYYHHAARKLLYAGAHTPLFYGTLQGDAYVMTSIKGDRQSIGYEKLDKHYQFTDHEIMVTDGMRFYLTTDGYFDQLGGRKGVPLGRKAFQQLLLDIQTMPLDEQSAALMRLLRQHQQQSVQTDDITVLGFEL